MVVGIGFTIILIFAVSIPSNLKGLNQGIVIGFFVLLILLFLLMSFLYGRVYVKIGKNKIYWRKMNGKEYEVRYEELTSYTIDVGGNLRLYQGDKCMLTFATGTHKVFVTEVLKNHRIASKDNGNETLILKSGKGYVIFYLVFCLCSSLLFLMCAYYGIFVGILVFFICATILFVLAIEAMNNRILVEENTILEKNLFRKRKIDSLEGQAILDLTLFLLRVL